jgi:hypothetical protein
MPSSVFATDMMQQSKNSTKRQRSLSAKFDWTPPPAKYPDGTLVPLKIGINEIALQNQVRSLGGRWDKEQQVWFVPYGCIAGTKLEKLIVVETTKEVKNVESL